MKKEIYLGILYDYYGDLLTDKQKEYFENYYFENLSLGEISENMKVSRNAIHKQLKVIEEKLLFFEEKLNIYKKEKQLKDILENTSDNKLKEEINKILWYNKNIFNKI